eukprot:Opistho-2@45410
MNAGSVASHKVNAMYDACFFISNQALKRLSKAGLLHNLEHCDAHLCGRIADGDTGGLECGDLCIRTTLSAGNNGAGVAHAASGGSRAACNKRHDGLGRLASEVVLLEECSRILLRRSTNLTNENDALGLIVLEEDIKAVHEIGSVEWVAANTNTERLAKTRGGRLRNSLIREGARAGHNADLSSLVDVARHDTNFARIGLNNAGAVGSNQAGLVLAHKTVLDLDHVLLGDALSDGDGERNLGIDCLVDGLCGARGGNVYHARRGTSRLDGLGDRVEDGKTKMRRAALSRRDTTNELGAILDGLLAVECTLLAGEALADDLCVLVDEQILARLCVSAAIPNRNAHGRRRRPAQNS